MVATGTYHKHNYLKLKMFRALFEAYPKYMSPTEIAEVIGVEKKMDLIFTKQEIDFTKFKEAFPEGVILEPNLALIFEQNKLGLALDILLTSTIQNIIMEAEKQGLNDCINLIYDELIKEKFPDISRHSHMFYEGYA